MYEQEADRIADKVMRGETGNVVSPQQGRDLRHDARSESVEASNVVPPGGGEPLPQHSRNFFESRFGRDFLDVRVHIDARAARSADSLNALAYTFGSDVVFGTGQFAPGTFAGDRLIAHELAHVARGTCERVIQRKDKWPPLDIAVPDPDPTFAPAVKYPWQNLSLRETIYPFRDEMLSYFLRTYMEIDLDDPSTPVTPVTVEEWKAERLAIMEELEQIKEETEEAKKDKNTARLRELYLRQHRLEGDLKYLPELTKKGELPKGAKKKWTAYVYSKKEAAGAELTHDELLERILDRFDADPKFERYPKWLRYMVLHFSGMRYKTAHRSYAPAGDLVKRLRIDQLRFQLGAAPETEVADLAETAIADMETEQATTKKGSKRASAIKRRLTALRAVESVREAAFTKKGEQETRTAFEELMELEDERDALKAEIDSKTITDPDELAAKQKRVEEIEPLIEATEDKIDSKSLRKVRKRIDAAEDKRRAAVIQHEIGRAIREISQLDDTQVLSILKAMRDQDKFPEWVWREIVRTTALKLEVDEGSDWETVTAEEKTEKKGKDPVTRRWVEIMSAWQAETTAWRKKHGSDLSLVVIRAVCNEIAEMCLHARGLSPKGGISQKTQWYAAPGGGSTFKKPTSNAELKPGASLFFLEWSYKPAKDKVNIVRHDLGVDLVSEKGEILADGFTGADRWTYHFNPDTTIMRKRLMDPQPVVATVPIYETQHLNWTHEAQVVKVDSNRDRVLTFETGPIGLRRRWLKEVVNVWNVYLGFAPSTKEAAGIDEFLKDILPGR